MVAMRRRDLIKVVAGSVAAWPLAVRAQQTDRMRRIGMRLNLPEGDPQMQVRLGIFRQGPCKARLVGGPQYSHRLSLFRDTVELGEVRGKELMELQPELILAHGTPAAAAVRNLTRTVPVVFVVVSEPVAQGFVQSLSHPAGNITGLSYLEASLGAKWLELLKELAPQVVRVATIYNPDTAPNPVFFLHSAQTVAPLRWS
jgi:putative tryptophan/tyrosine transport system substrate-binding protein